MIGKLKNNFNKMHRSVHSLYKLKQIGYKLQIGRKTLQQYNIIQLLIGMDLRFIIIIIKYGTGSHR